MVFPCEWRAMPANATVVWYRDGIPVRQIATLESRIETPSEGSLIINPLHMDDSGFYECRVSNGIGETQSAVAYLNVECKYPTTATKPVSITKQNRETHFLYRKATLYILPFPFPV